MKKIALALALTLSASAPAAFAGDACEAVLCMAGEVMGKGGGGECSAAIGEFFGIVRFDSDGDFDPSATSDARESFLEECPAPDPQGWVGKIVGKFGSVLR